MKNLSRVLNKLKDSKNSFNGVYLIPGAWSPSGYDRYFTNRQGEMSVNPYDFMVYCIETQIISMSSTGFDYLKPIASMGETLKEFNPCKSVIYSMFPRAFTAWEHYKEGEICSGTLLKAICLLPHLKKLGVDIVYLLPVFEYSDRYKKGEIGSPYAIKNIYKLDHNLHDSLLGENTEDILETEFKAFVEACHILGMKVMLDFAFRTVSRDCDLIVEHPDWFYWIDYNYSKSFAVPWVENEAPLTVISDSSIENLYTCNGIKEYFSKCTYPPDKIDAKKWEKIVEACKKKENNILDLIEEEYGITTVPGFPDVLNDPQPPWTDATYLKFYFDYHNKAKQYVSKTQPPYILQDGACLNIYQGEIKNIGLWEYIADAIPYYQEKYGLDGARIDMGHALPPELNREIIARVIQYNKDFILWSEELHEYKSNVAKEDGFHFITGSTWKTFKTLDEGGFNRNIVNTLLNAEIPVTAALETADTPRASHVYLTRTWGDKKRLEMMVLLSYFAPNAIPFINNGMELVELQPMNLGLDNTEEGRFVLPKEDPMYGKLAFFDKVTLHWLNPERKWMMKLLETALNLRNRFIDIVSKKENCINQYDYTGSSELVVSIRYFDPTTSKGVCIVANKSEWHADRFKFSDLLSEQARQCCKSARLVYAGWNLCDVPHGLYDDKYLSPGEVIIGYIE